MHETGPTEPDIGLFLDLIGCRLQHDLQVPAKTRANALWALVHAADNRYAVPTILL